MPTIRAFIAITLPTDVKQALGVLSTRLADRVAPRSVRWVTPDRLHLTLRFLGDTAVSKLPDVKNTMDTVAGSHPPLSLHLNDLGCFPNRRRPRVIWVGLGGDLAQMQTLKTGLDEALAPLGWPVDNRPFRPHLTLGRVKNSRLVQDMPWDVHIPALNVPVTAIHLIESRLTPDGPIYTLRHTGQLYQPARA